jgi:hypothetical protein
MTVKSVGSGKVGRAAPATELLTKNVKMDVKTSFSDVMPEDQKDLQEVSTGIGQFLKKSDIYECCLEFDIKVSKVNFDLTRLN